jgi:hypothetical protein
LRLTGFTLLSGPGAYPFEQEPKSKVQPNPDNADLLSANLLVKQSLRLGIFKTIAPTFPLGCT